MTFYLLCLGLEERKKKGLQVTKSEGFNHKHGIKNVFFKQLNHDNSSAAMTTIFIVFALFWGMFYYNQSIFKVIFSLTFTFFMCCSACYSSGSQAEGHVVAR